MNELERIQSIIIDVLSGAPLVKHELHENNHYTTLIESEMERIRRSFIQQDLSIHSEPYLQKYFQFHQIGTIRLVDILFERIGSCGEGADTKLISFLLRSVKELLSFIQNQFPTYFNYSTIAPISVQQTILGEIERKMHNVQVIENNEFVEREIFKIAVAPLISTIQASEKCLTYKRLSYLSMLQSELLNIDLSIKDKSWITVILCNVLVEINFNDPSFLSYYTKHVKNALLACETLVDRIDQTAYFQKLISQISVKRGLAFDPAWPSAKDQLLEWIGFELHYLREKSLLQLSPRDPGINKDFKIIFDLSVAQLAYVFRLLTAMGIIQNKNSSELIRFLTKFVKTKRAESVSYESLRIKFYNTEIGTKDAVKKTFQSLLSYINKN